jgi:type I restriction enzyme, S subunit
VNMQVRAAQVGDIVRLSRDPVTINPEELYRQIGVYSFGKGLIRRDPTPGAQLGKLRFFRIPENSLVVSNIQAWEGAVAFSRPEDSEFIGSNRFLCYKAVNPSVVDANYLHYYFLCESGHRMIRRVSPGAMARNRTLNISAFEALRIPLPELGEQKRIAGWLDHINESRESILRRAEDAARGANALRGRLCDIGGSLVMIGDKIELSRNPVSIDPGKHYRQIGIYSFGKGVIHRDPKPGANMDKLRYFSIPFPALIVSNIQAWEGAIAVSSPKDTQYVASNRFLSYVPKSDDVDISYLRHFLLDDRGMKLIRRASPGTMARNRTLGIDAFESIKIPWPSIAEQRFIASVLDKMYEVVQRIQERERTLDELLASALNEAFSGLG